MRNKRQLFLKAAMTAIALLALMIVSPTRGNATPITVTNTCVGQGSPCPGLLNLGNFSIADSLQTNPSPPPTQVACINFYNTTPAPCVIGSEPAATVTVNNPHDSLFSATTGTMYSIDSGQTFPEIGQLVLGTTTFDLDSLVQPNPVACPPATTPGSCAIAGTPFVFQQVTGGANPTATVTLVENLCAYVTGTSSGGSSCSTGTPYSATVKTEFDNYIPGTYTASSVCPTSEYSPTLCAATVTNLINIVAAGGTITDSASIVLNPTSTTPEPISFVLFGSGLVCLSFLGRRYRRS